MSCVSNTDIPPRAVSHRYRDMADSWFSFRGQQKGVPLLKAFVVGEPLNSGLRNFAPRNW